MKNKFFKLLYKIFSFLADKTNGWKIFVNPKLFFGALIIGVTAVSTNSCGTKSGCYKTVVEDTIPQNDTISEVMKPSCYEPTVDCVIPPNDSIVMCYDSPTIEENSQN